MKRVRFETVSVCEKCQTEYKENIMKTEQMWVWVDKQN